LIEKIKNKLSDKNFKDLFKSSSIVTIAKILGVILGFTTNIIIARYYGADTVGVVALVNSFIAIASLFVLFGTNTSIIKLIPQYQAKYSISSSYYIFKKSLTFIFVVGIFITVLLYFISPTIAETIFKNSDLTPYFIVASFFIFFISAKELNLGALRGLHDIKIFSILNLLPSAITLLAIIISTFHFYDKSMPIYIYILVPAFMFIVTYYFITIKFKEKLPKKQEITINKIKFQEILTISFPMLLISSMHLVMSQTDIIMIGIYMSESDVGLYVVAIKLALLTSFVLNAVNSVVSPKFSLYYHSGDMEALKKTAKDSSKLIFYTTFPILLFLLIFGKYILGIFGEEFESAYIILVILIAGQIINVYAGSIDSFLIMTGYQNNFQNILIFGLIINVVLNIILIPIYGLIGAAIATTLSFIIWKILALMLMKREFGFTTKVYND
jgi:O-antigen/teichoic acid export membrane protein